MVNRWCLTLACLCLALTPKGLDAQGLGRGTEPLPAVPASAAQLGLGVVNDLDTGALRSGFQYVYAVKEKNHGEAALYALLGVPALAPLGQLYNGELDKAGKFLIVKALCAGMCAIAGAAWVRGTYGERNTEAAWFWVTASAYAGVSIYSVVDAVISAEAINRHAMENGVPSIRVGLQKRF